MLYLGGAVHGIRLICVVGKYVVRCIQGGYVARRCSNIVHNIYNIHFALKFRFEIDFLKK